MTKEELSQLAEMRGVEVYERWGKRLVKGEMKLQEYEVIINYWCALKLKYTTPDEILEKGLD